MLSVISWQQEKKSKVGSLQLAVKTTREDTVEGEISDSPSTMNLAQWWMR